jgi:ATP-dependent helicase/nuclease subunit A
MNEVVTQACAAQGFASDPAASAFVSANAGTGKTKVLSERVLRLLLNGAVADGILCVTYTRAAAAEMRNRIARQLGNWVVMPTAALRDELAAMGIATPSQDMLARARRLFAEILDNDHGPRVETVHSFCQSILSRFPIEAGIAPHTSLADDSEQDALRAAARAAVMHSPDPVVSEAVMLLAEQINEDQLQKVLASFVQTETRLGSSSLFDDLWAHFRDDLGLGDAQSIETRLRAVIKGIDTEGLRAVAVALRESGVTKQASRGAGMDAWLAEEEAGRLMKIDLLVEALFTAGKPRTVLANAAIRKAYGPCEDIQRALQNQLLPCMADRAAQRCRVLTTALYQFGAAYRQEYTALKRARAVLDYDDLIALTNDLMGLSTAAQWVAWKLDNGVQHLLIDEAQDTSPAQWQLLRRLSAEFFDDLPDEQRRPQTQPAASQLAPTQPAIARTVFAVGDFKQSIYSFQGADPRVMSASRADFAARASERQRPFRQVSLSVSFRSSVPVLALVNAAIDGLPGIEDFTPHLVTDAGKGGFVELLELIEADDAPANADPFAPPAIATATGASAKSALQIAEMIKGWVGQRPLANGRMMQAGDIMILLRKRGTYFNQLLAALRRAKVPVAGADRMRLEEQIEIQDLLALGDVITLPEDDLQLAALLKSPLFGMDEAQLFSLAHNRGKASLHAALMRHAGADSPLGQMADLLGQLRNAADKMSVYAFYSFVLDTKGRAAFRARLGQSIDESLDQFLGLAQAFGRGGGASLTEFLVTLRATGGEIKRDLDTAGLNAVRIMTIHGAKGLEAPVVVLPDTLRAAPPADPLCKDEASGFVYWAQGSAFRPDFITAARDPAKQRRNEEDKRLLYVALTRAREGLVIGGWNSSARSLRDSDYELLRDRFGAMDGVVKLDDGALHLSHRGDDRPADDTDRPPTLPRQSLVPDWLLKPAPVEPAKARPVRPSEPSFDVVTSRPAQAAASGHAMERGRLAHRLFEVLPALPPETRQITARRVMQNHPHLPKDDAEQVLDEVLQVMTAPALERLFLPDALAEVPVNGVVAGVGVAGQIDRLQVDETSVVFADFKTGTRGGGDAPLSYQRQMALYAALLEQIYPSHRIEGWLVWTEAASSELVTAAQRVAALRDFGEND